MRELRLTQALACARPFMVLACSTLIILLTSIGALAQCDPEEGSIEGIVFMDSQTDGTFSTGELGIANVMITAYDAEGVSLGFAMSDGVDIFGRDVDSTPDESQDNDSGGKANSPTDDSVDLARSIDKDDQDPAMMQFVSGEFFSQCLCIAPNSGQFGNEIIITAPAGQTWYIDQTVGLNDFMFNGTDYTIMPYIPGIDGHNLEEYQFSDAESEYYFPAVSLDGQAFQITFRNENDDAVTLAGGPCNNEIIIVDGAFSLCEGATETYTVTNPTPGETYGFDLDSGGTIIDATPTSVTIEWDNAIGGPYELIVTNTSSGIFNGSLGNANCQSPTLVGGVGIRVGQADGPMTCIGDVNISLNENCELLVRPQTVAAGPLDPSAPYSIMLTMPDGTVIPNNVLTEEHIGIEVTAKLIEGCGGNSCWSTITVEDKLAPVLYCDDTEIVCYNYDTYQGPIAIDACDGNVEAYQVGAEEIFVYDCHPDFVRKVTRQYQAEDSKGNTSGICTIEIFVKKINIDDIVYPADIVGDDAFACDEVEYNEDGYPTLESTGVPTINGEPLLPGITPLCNIAMDYNDRLVGPIGCTTKVMREFRLVYNECSSTQIISNGSFESGDFTDWEELGPTGFGCDQDWNVEMGPVGFCLSLEAAPDGTQAAYVAADGNGPLEREIRQIVSVPLDVTAASLSWQQTYSIDLMNYCVGCMARMYAIEIYDVSGTTLLGIVHEEMFMAGQNYNQPWTANSSDITSLLSSLAGQDVMLSVKIMIPESFTGPGILGVDAFELDVTTSDAMPITKIFKYTQTIELEDNNPPVFVQMDDITVSAGSGDCEASVFLPAPEVTDACAEEIEIDIRYPGGFANDQSSTFVLLPSGISEVTYLAYDECGNVDSMKINVTVMDMTAPVVVCDVPTALGINSDGIGYAYAATFDDGSTDACGIDYMKVRRLDNGADCGPESTTFGDFVVFCCADVGNEVMVEFQVVDFAGNANSCMVSVVVQDKFPPAISCPADVTVDCDTPFNLEDLDEYGTAIATDACMVTIEEEAMYAPENACGEGVITRTFVASDNNGSATCTQTITFVNDSPFLLGDITFPPNYDTEICDREALEPEQLPAPFNEPQINDDACDMVAFAHSDELFDFTGDNACYKIYRTWTVINWCVMVNGTPETFVGFQVIKVNNSSAPEIVEDSEPLIVCSFDDNCESGDITLTKTATDDCTLPANLRWEYTINLESGIVINDNGTGNTIDASGNYELGDHSIIYTFEDRCGNVVSRIQTFSIQNCTPPNAVCIDGLSVELVPMDTDNDGEVDAEMACLFAHQLNASSSHTCDLPLVYSFSADTSNTKILLDCSYLGENEVTLWVTDSNGNTDICISTLTVQDNNEVDICNNLEECVTFPENATITTCNADLTPVILGLVPVVDTDCTNCDDFDVTYTDVLFTYPNTDCNYIERFFVVTFNCFNSPIIVEGSHIISLLDAVAPTINCPADGSEVATDGSGLSCEAFVTLDPATFISNCNSIVTITNDSAFADDDGADASGAYPVGTTEVTFTASDACNNSSTCTIVVVVTDEMSPTCNISDITVNVTSTGSTIIDLGDINNQSTDACGGTVTVVSVTPNSFSCADIGAINFITVVVEDASGNQAECTDIGLTIIDIEDPVCSTQDITVSINPGETSVTVTPDMVDLGSVDNCSSIQIMSLDQTQFTCDQLGSQTVTLTVTDQFNNTSTCTSIVTVEETVPPTCVAGTITLSIGIDGTATLDPAEFGVGSSDDCGSIDLYDASQTIFTCADLGENTITLTVTDTNNNTSTCTGTVIIEETEAPMCVTQDITVNILDGQTSVSINPADVDDGSSDGCGTVTLVSVVPSSFTCDDLGENTVTLTVEDTNGNTSECTALVTVGDLVPPTCNAGTFTITLTDTGSVTVAGEDLDNGSTDDCGTIVSYSVFPNTFDCTQAGDNSVTLTVTDDNGNSSTCEGTVIVVDNVAPVCNTKDITISLDDNGAVLINAFFVNDGSLDPCGGALQSLTVNPFSFNCEDIGDNIVVMTVIDASGNSSTCEATVTIEDTDAPTCQVQDITVSLTTETGTTVDPADFDNGSTDECGGPLTFEVDQSTFDCNDLGMDNLVVITVTDQYGNSSTCTANVTVEDDIEIQCIAQDITVNLESNGMVIITPEQIDNGSTAGCDQPITLSLDRDDFTCNDASFGEIEVTLTVTVDASGETSECTANVTVVDTIAPTITCMDDVTVDCIDFTGNLEPYGNIDDIEASDNCGAGLAITEGAVVENINVCGIGTYTRTFIATDLAGNADTCTQIVTVILGDNPLVEEDLTFPPDTVTFGDCSAFNPDNLDTTVAIDSMAAECFNVSISFVDTGINVDMPCNDTITRTYTVLDSCQIGTGAGLFTFDQTIIINDTTAPTITGPVDLTVTVQDTMTCTFALDLSGFNVDNCDENFTVTNNSVFADTQDSGDASGDYPVGEYEITLTATDNCSNSSSYVYNVTVLDTTYVYLTCLKLEPDMEADLLVDVNSIRLADTIQFFNCLGTPVDTIISYSNTDMNDTIRVYGCEAVQQPVQYWIYLYVDGIVADSCRGTVQLLDPTDLCNDGLVGTVVGTVFTTDNEPVPGVLVDLDGSDESIMTDEDGYYAFPEMIGGEAYEVIPTKDDDPMNGVTTLDLILIQRHILGLTELDSPYDLIAADIDASGSLSGIDIIQLRKMILGIYNEFPDNTSWRMVDRGFAFWDPTNAQEEAFPETYDIDALVSTMKADFIGVKTGDVNGSVIPSLDSNLESETRADKTWYLQAIDKNVKAGESVTVEIMITEDTDLQGFQMAVSTEMIRDISLASSSISITEDNYSIDRYGVINISWNTLDELQLTAGSKILEVTLVPTVDTKLSQMISISDEGVESQTYANNDIAYTRTEILWETGMSEFALYQNTPNPWTQSTDINFMIPTDGKVTINVRSVNGQKIKTFEGYYESGVHSVKLTNQDLIESGVYYYEMRYDNQIVVEKMILLR